MLVCGLCLAAGPALAADWFVATNGSDAAAGTNWATAKLTIQSAIDAAVSNDTVWVSNGVYATGGRVVVGTWSNRVAIDKPITVRSVNGPEATIIAGNGRRCAYVTNGAVLSGFTLTNGVTGNSGVPHSLDGNPDDLGGGAFCENTGMLTNCILAYCWAMKAGGGVSGGSLYDCTVRDNDTWHHGGGAISSTMYRCLLRNNRCDLFGAGAFGCTLNGCTLTGNRAGGSGGGAFDSVLSDCLLRDNNGNDGGGVYFGTLQRCTLEGNRSAGSYGGGGACDAVLYNCLLVGNQAWSNPEEYARGGGARNCTLVNCTVASNKAFYGGGVFGGVAINTVIYGNAATNDANWTGGAFTNCCTTPLPTGSANITNDPQFVDAAAGEYRLDGDSPCINAGFDAAAPGDMDLNGGARIVFGRVDMGAYEYNYLHVATNGSDSADAMSWATAKQTLQAAVDAATNGCTVWVSNGVYATGGRVVPGSVVTNRVAIDKPITVQSVNGPGVTTIQGEGPVGAAAVRCAYVGTNAVLTGFTLTNGVAGDWGGGAYCEESGTLNYCILTGNSAFFGGGMFGGTARQCVMAGNTAFGQGGGSSMGKLRNCTVAGNSAGIDGGGVDFGLAVINCIVYGNSAPTSPNYNAGDFSHSCTTPDPGGTGNTTNDPKFVDAAAGDYRLQAASPCIDAGDDSAVSWSEDLDGNQRMVYGAVDMGAYEAQLAGAGTWFGAITNGLTNDTDCVAGDGVPNLLKYATGSSPRISDGMMQVGLMSGDAPTLVFNRNPHATDVTMVVEGAESISNGAAWRGLATNINGSWGGAANVSESGTGNPVVCTVEDLVQLGAKRFLRLKVTRP